MVLLKVAISLQNYGFVVRGFGVVIFCRLVVGGAAGYGLLFGLPPHKNILLDCGDQPLLTEYT